LKEDRKFKRLSRKKKAQFVALDPKSATFMKILFVTDDIDNDKTIPTDAL
jgi:hypothetical protein